MTVIVGALIGISWRRFSSTHMFGGITDMLLGITGAFAARWLLDVFSLFGVGSSSYDIVFILWGAGLLGAFTAFWRSGLIRQTLGRRKFLNLLLRPAIQIRARLALPRVTTGAAPVLPDAPYAS